MITEIKGSDLDAPSRGHDLKLFFSGCIRVLLQDTPSRGHDLKQFGAVVMALVNQMPPHGGMT